MSELINKMLVPYKFRSQFGEITIIADMHVPDDQVLIIDKDGHVHKLVNLGRLIDQVEASDE